ncbi:FecR domain-containing protein [Porticoccus sp. W117]|uniref:FecR family protein n=1 Tax=Porticoccus sp. W117 TaxID=3054777 RepID=UPI002593EBEF|nr:FecR domain-containing protein [Porticoccus sp. W117]MDM3869771.1 FecR domain-containing protein [Porticoccus sp. W117]
MNWLNVTTEESRAAEDTVRLFSGERSTKDLDDLSGWSERQCQHSQCLYDTWRLLAEMDGLKDDQELLSLATKPRSWLGSNGIRNGLTAVAATVLLAVAVIFGTEWLNPVETQSNKVLRYVTQVGEQKTVDLPDGSAVTLNTSSVVLVDYSDTARRLVLDRGEAFFTVAKDAARPFTVELGSRSVTALGTAFNIYLLPEKFTLAVTEGVVSLHRKEETVSQTSPQLDANKDKPLTVKQPNQLRISAGTIAEYELESQQLTARYSDDIDNFQSWRSRIIRFDAEPLFKVVKELNRYSAKKILIEDDSVMNLPLYSTVHLDHMNEALGVFERALPIKVMHRFDRIVIVGNHKKK